MDGVCVGLNGNGVYDFGIVGLDDPPGFSIILVNQVMRYYFVRQCCQYATYAPYLALDLECLSI